MARGSPSPGGGGRRRGLKFGKGEDGGGGPVSPNKPRREQERGGCPLAHRLLPNFHRSQEPESPGARQSGGWSLPKNSRLPRPGPGTWLRPRGVVAGPTRWCQPRSPLPEPAGGRGDLGGDLAPPCPGAALLHHALVSGFILFIYLFFNYFFPRDPRVEVATGAPGVMGGGPVGTQPPGLPKEGLCPALVHAAVPRTWMQPAGF